MTSLWDASDLPASTLINRVLSNYTIAVSVTFYLVIRNDDLLFFLAVAITRLSVASLRFAIDALCNTVHVARFHIVNSQSFATRRNS